MARALLVNNLMPLSLPLDHQIGPTLVQIGTKSLVVLVFFYFGLIQYVARTRHIL